MYIFVLKKGTVLDFSFFCLKVVCATKIQKQTAVLLLALSTDCTEDTVDSET